MNTTKAQDCPRLLLRVLVADSDRPVNEGLTAMLSDLEGIAIFGCAQEPAKVVALVERVHPDVVILDLEVPGPVGLRTLRQLKHVRISPVVIVLSHYTLPVLREVCLSAGADCFLEKTGAFERLRELLTGLAQAAPGAGRQRGIPGEATRPTRASRRQESCGGVGRVPSPGGSDRALMRIVANSASNSLGL